MRRGSVWGIEVAGSKPSSEPHQPHQGRLGFRVALKNLASPGSLGATLGSVVGEAGKGQRVGWVLRHNEASERGSLLGRMRWDVAGMWSWVQTKPGGSEGRCDGREEGVFAPPNTVRCSCSAVQSGSAWPPAGCASAVDAPPAVLGPLGSPLKKDAGLWADEEEIQVRRRGQSGRTCTWPQRQAAVLASWEGFGRPQVHTSNQPRSRRHDDQGLGKGGQPVGEKCPRQLDHPPCCAL